MDRITLPLVVSIASHAVVLTLLIVFAGEIRPSPEASVPGGIEVVFGRFPEQTHAAPTLEKLTQPAPANTTSLPPEAERTVEAAALSPAPVPELPVPPSDQPATLSASPPPARHKRVVREPPKHGMPRPEKSRGPALEPAPAPAKFAETHPVGIAGAQNSAAEAASIASPSVKAPDVTVSYQAMISAWLESHKRYPESARERGEEGSAALRFRIDRSGRVLDYSYRSTGYADLDAGLDEMLRGAQLPPFPPGITASRIEITLTMGFKLTR
ncbi:MAG: energy transducer TonB [Alphaproteobacteria bacterium]|nr:energy transducer TonB [Alphaproteobacteria bacterium]